MPSKRRFAKRVAALAATGLGVGSPIEVLTSEPPPGGTLAVQAATPDTQSEGDQTGDRNASQNAGDLRSAVANGKYDPGAAAVGSVDTVVTARGDPTVLTTTGLPATVGQTVRQLLTRYESLSLRRLQAVTGGVVLTSDGLEGCAVATGNINAAVVSRELRGDPDFVRERRRDSEFVHFQSESVQVAIAVRPDELVVAHGPSVATAVRHRNAGLNTTERWQSSSETRYGSLPSVLGGDVTVCVDLGADIRNQLLETLTDAPNEFQTAVDSSAAIGVSLRTTGKQDRRTVTDTAAVEAPRPSDSADESQMSLRYGAVADPKRLDRDTVEAIATAVQNDETGLSDATVARHGRTVTLDATVEDELFASHASLLGLNVRDRIEITDV